MAIILANLAFSAIHLPLSGLFAAIVFPFGLFWGWSFYKQRSLLGVSISHILIGLWGLQILGMEPLLH